VIIPPFVTLYNGVKRFQRAQETTLGEATLSGWVVLVLVVAAFIVGVAAPIIPGYLQAELNKIWERQPRLGIEATTGDADIERIKKLAELKDTGAISAEEFEAEKARLLRSPHGSTTDHP
jgi:Short C-terminal domain